MVVGIRGCLLALTALVLFVTGVAADAQQTESRILGKVLDSSKAPIPGVTVTVTSAPGSSASGHTTSVFQ